LGTLYSLFGIVEPRYRHDRPEHFSLYDLIGMQRIGNDSRLIIEAAAADLIAAGRDGNMLPARSTLDETFDALAMRSRDQRPDLVLFVVGQVVLYALHRRRQVGHQIVVDLLGDIHAARRGAVLPGIVVAEGLDALDDGGHVGVIEHDHG